MMAAPALSMEWVPDGSGVRWDRPTKLVSGDNIPSNDGIVYEISSKHETSGVINVLGTTQAEEFTVNLGGEGYYYVGVRAARIVNGTQLKWSDQYTWSNSTDPVAVPVPFGVTMWLELEAIRGLSPK